MTLNFILKLCKKSIKRIDVKQMVEYANKLLCMFNKKKNKSVNTYHKVRRSIGHLTSSKKK